MVNYFQRSAAVRGYGEKRGGNFFHGAIQFFLTWLLEPVPFSPGSVQVEKNVGCIVRVLMKEPVEFRLRLLLCMGLALEKT